MLSIIIVNYNGLKYLKKCLDSIFEQTYKDLEIVLVDNCSTDTSVEFIKNNYPSIKIVMSQKNLGFASGNNLGIKSSKGELVMLLNNDTWMDQDFLEKLTKFYDENDYDVVAPLENDYQNSNKPIYIIKIDPFGHPIYISNPKDFDNQFYLSGVCLLFKRKLYNETGGLDNDFFMYFEEIDWFWRLHLLNKKIGVDKTLYIHHFGSGTTGSGIKYSSFLWRNQNTLQMLLKNYSWYNLTWVLPVYFIQNFIEIIFFILDFKPNISFAYIKGWLFNIKNIRNIIKERTQIQKIRVVGDRLILKKMYFGSAKIKHFINFYGNK